MFYSVRPGNERVKQTFLKNGQKRTQMPRNEVFIQDYAAGLAKKLEH